MATTSSPSSSTPTHVSGTPTTENRPFRPSNAIQTGADRLLEFFLQEQNKLNNIHREELRNAVARYNELKLRSESDLAVTQFKSQSRTIALHDISAKYQKAQHDAIMARQELEELRAEHERLKAAVKQVGFVYTDGTLSPGQDSREHSSQVLDQH